MDPLSTLWETFFDWDAMREALPEMLTVGLPNTLILAVSAALLGSVLGMLLAVAGISRSRWLRWPARVYTDVFRGLPAAATILLIGVGLAPLGMQVWGPNPYPLGILALSLIAAAYIGEIFRSGIQSVEAAQLEGARALGFSWADGDAAGDHPAGHPAGAAGLGEPAHRADQGLQPGLLPRPGGQPAGAVPDRAGLRGHHRQRVGAAAGRALYLALTVPLTHVVNWIDRRLRNGRPATGADRGTTTTTAPGVRRAREGGPAMTAPTRRPRSA